MEISEEAFERRLSFSHYGGKTTGIEDCAAIAMRQANDLFSAGKNDEAAKLFRDFSIKLKELALVANAERKKYEDID